VPENGLPSSVKLENHHMTYIVLVQQKIRPKTKLDPAGKS
jgi:hypothetical protein